MSLSLQNYLSHVDISFLCKQSLVELQNRNQTIHTAQRWKKGKKKYSYLKSAGDFQLVEDGEEDLRCDQHRH